MAKKSFLKTTYATARRLAVALIGGSLILFGVIMIIFPGPALLLIPLGLAVLGVEFAWARRWLRRLKQKTFG